MADHFIRYINRNVLTTIMDCDGQSSQVVNSNLPASFNLIVPIFKGRPAEEIEVEIIADVDGRNIRLSLCSPGAEVIVEEERNKAIDEQLLLIRKLAPDIAIIEQ